LFGECTLRKTFASIYSVPDSISRRRPRQFDRLQTSALNDLDQYQHDSDDQENMNDAAHGVRGKETQKPEDD
jgi:hypothetical protein